MKPKPMYTRLLLLIMFCLFGSGNLIAAKSGYEYIKPETRELQDDDFENPGMLTVEQGNELFNHPTAGAEKACADCHGRNGEDLDVQHIAAYPVYDQQDGQVVTLQDRLVRCSGATGHTMAPDDKDRIALETFVRHLARGEAVAVNTDGAEQQLEQGQKLFNTRYGLIDMSCRHCHGFYPGEMVRGQRISEGMGNGFPAYRLAIGEMTTLQQRIQQCLRLMRAEPFESGSEELRLMELYMMTRSNGLPIETPAVRY